VPDFEKKIIYKAPLKVKPAIVLASDFGVTVSPVSQTGSMYFNFTEAVVFEDFDMFSFDH